MSGLTWIHLSDWHHKKDFGIDPEVVRDHLLKDIRERSSCISPDLEKIDFIVFSGQNSPDYSNTKTWSINGKKVPLLGINSA